MATEPIFEVPGPDVSRARVCEAIRLLGYDPTETSSLAFTGGPDPTVEVVAFLKAPQGGGKGIKFLDNDRKGYVKVRVVHDVTGPYVVANDEETS